MSHAEELPTLVALTAATCVVVGAMLALIGSIGLLRLKSFYERVHAPTLGTTLGTAFVLIASMVIFMTVTTPVTFVLLVRAALHRDRAEGNDRTTGGTD
jgi:multicomponent K+:H+ antiporter subunit G